MTELWRPGNHILGAGVLFFDDGEGERPIIETDQLVLSAEVETVERWRSIDGPAEVVDQAIARVRRTLTTGTVDIRTENLAMLFGGTVASHALGTTYTAAATHLNRYYQCTPIPAPFTLSTITFSSEPSPVEGTHYAVDLTRGRVQVLQDGLGQLDVTFTASSASFLDIPQAEVRGGLRFLSDPTVGTGRDGQWPDCIIRPSEPLALKSRSDWMRIGFAIEVLSGSSAVSLRETAGWVV